MLTLLIEALFALVCVHACVSYLRTRDPLHRDVMAVFSAMASIFVVTVLTEVLGGVPRILELMGITLLLGQPYLTLRLAAQLRPVRSWVRWTALLGWLGTTIPVLAFGEELPQPVVLAAVASFAFGETSAAYYFAAEAKRRAGSSRIRLAFAATATALFAVAIVASGAGAGQAATIIVLVSAAGYLLAFMPPRWLRHMWSIRAGYTLIRDLLSVRRAETRPRDLEPVRRRRAPGQRLRRGGGAGPGRRRRPVRGRVGRDRRRPRRGVRLRAGRRICSTHRHARHRRPGAPRATASWPRRSPTGRARGSSWPSPLRAAQRWRRARWSCSTGHRSLFSNDDAQPARRAWRPGGHPGGPRGADDTAGRRGGSGGLRRPARPRATSSPA